LLFYKQCAILNTSANKNKQRAINNMEATTDTQSANLSETFAAASWNVPRSIEQLRSFVSSREDALDVEDFDF
jgi:hypothetical protein